MPIYRYVATDPFGVATKGKLAAQSEQEVQVFLRRSRLTPARIYRTLLDLEVNRQTTVKFKDLIIFTRMLATMLDASVPLGTALKGLSEHAESPVLRQAINRLLIDIEQGSTLGEGIRSERQIFGPVYANMVKAGEDSGNLDLLLDRLADMMEKTEKVRARVKSAMVYPAILATVATAVVIVLLTFVVPKFIGVFHGAGVELPLPTRLALAVSSFLGRFWIMVALAPIALFFAFRWLARQPWFKRWRDRALMRTPVLRHVVVKGAAARFARTLSTLIGSGVSIVDALELTADVTGNEVVTQALLEARLRIASGRDIAGALRETGIFPPAVGTMVAAGETSGELEKVLAKVADYYEEDVDRAVDAALKFVEPVLLVIFGFVAGLIVLALYLPLFQMISVLGHGGT